MLDAGGAAQRSTTEGRAPRLALLRGPFLDRAEAETLAHVEAVAARLARAGATLRERALPPSLELALDVHHVIMISEAAAYHAAAHAAHADAYRPLLRATIEAGSLVPAVAYLQAQRLRVELRQEAEGLFDGVDGLLMPAALGPAPRRLESTGNPAFNAPWSLFGLPALALPSGLSKSGMPLSLQIIGPPRGDERVLDTAAWCESVLGPLPPLSPSSTR